MEAKKKISILSLNRAELKEAITNLGLKPFIASQVLDWVYKKYCRSFEEMNNISKANHARLAEAFDLNPFSHVDDMLSEKGRAVKLIATLKDGKLIESVVLKEKGYNTLCVSSQCGCPVDCKFCLTGINGFFRHLTSDEIVAQVLEANRRGHPISNLVFMGMGEPMLNYDNVFKAIDIMTSEDSFNISKRKIIVSTSGYLRNIQRLIDEKRFINLAFSVGHPNPQRRAELMPIEKRQPILDVARLIKKYQRMHNRKLTLEYTLIKGKNDDDQALKELGNLSKYLDAKVNIINLNPHPKIPFEPVSVNRLNEVKQFLRKQDVQCTVRVRKGDDISAACGQLGGRSSR